MNRSWNWRIREFTASDATYVARQFAADDPFKHYAGQCRHKGCTKAAECYVLYDYSTGARGRVSTAQKQFCRPHAEHRMAGIPAGQRA